MCVTSETCLQAKAGRQADESHTKSRSLSISCFCAGTLLRTGESQREPSWFSKLHFLGGSSQALVLKVRVHDVGFKPFAPQGEA